MGRYVGKCNNGPSSSSDNSEIISVLGVSSSSSTRARPYNVYQLRSRRRNLSGSQKEPPTAFPTSDVVVGVKEESGQNCSTSVVTSDDCPASCSSSNNLVLVVVTDPQVESGRNFDSRITVAARSDEEDPKQESDDGGDCPGKSTVQIKMPSESEIEDFFTVAEKDLQQRFSDKYNFDIVKDVPLEGRYEWVKIKP